MHPAPAGFPLLAPPGQPLPIQLSLESMEHCGIPGTSGVFYLGSSGAPESSAGRIPLGLPGAVTGESKVGRDHGSVGVAHSLTSGWQCQGTASISLRPLEGFDPLDVGGLVF